MRLLVQLALLVAFLLPSVTAIAETVRLEEGVPGGMLDRIFPIRSGSNTGTCFVIDVDERQYLVTARHVVPGIKTGDKVEIYLHGSWVPLAIIPIFPNNEKIDAVALAADTIIAARLDLPVGTPGIVLGQKVFFLGFPFGLASRSKNRNDFIPFIKAGILSAIDYGDNTTALVYIDGHNNPGFSGGPVIFANLAKDHQLQIAAVISGYRNQPIEVIDVTVPDKPTSENKDESASKNNSRKIQVVLENTGIIVAHQLNELVEAIRSNPQGPKHIKTAP
jgi:S1-C subfamily serine protease